MIWPIAAIAVFTLGYGIARLVALKRDLDRYCTTEPEPRCECGHTRNAHAAGSKCFAINRNSVGAFLCDCLEWRPEGGE